jgi:hypothetical protein
MSKKITTIINQDGGIKPPPLTKEWGELWEDFYDILVSESRKKEPTVPWSELKAEMEQEERKIG